MGESGQQAPKAVAIVRESFERWANEDLPGTLELFDDARSNPSCL